MGARGNYIRLCFALLMLLAYSSAFAAPTTRPEAAAPNPAVSSSSIDSKLIRRGNAQPTPGSASPAPTSNLEGPRVALALAAVVALIFVLRSLARRFFDMPG